jgi:hypothetical protein
MPVDPVPAGENLEQASVGGIEGEEIVARYAWELDKFIASTARDANISDEQIKIRVQEIEGRRDNDLHAIGMAIDGDSLVSLKEDDVADEEGRSLSPVRKRKGREKEEAKHKLKTMDKDWAPPAGTKVRCHIFVYQ